MYKLVLLCPDEAGKRHMGENNPHVMDKALTVNEQEEVA